MLGQLKAEAKSNEITAMPELLRVLELSGCIVTLDAMGYQKKIAKEIKEADADYVLALKDNQETVHQEVQQFLDDAVAEQKAWRAQESKPRPLPPSWLCLRPSKRDHGRIVTRRYHQSDQTERFAQFPALRRAEKRRDGGIRSRNQGTKGPTMKI